MSDETCTVCRRALWEHEIGHQACTLCVNRTDANLVALAGPNGLYAQLPAAMMPGRSGSPGRVSGSRTAPIPPRLGPLNLSAPGGIITTLQMWAEDWATYGRGQTDWHGTLQQQLDQAVTTLRFNIHWAAQNHPAWKDFAEEVRQAKKACEASITGERECPILLACGTCGHGIPYTLTTPQRTCGTCHRVYGWVELRQLRPIAERAAA
ncbi:hypothetical protein [Streptomyces albus]|uniref:hypothetical protein n=1 Tax=Streptomyces albus TaxID=1888 RepID=UPI0033E72C6B